MAIRANDHRNGGRVLTRFKAGQLANKAFTTLSVDISDGIVQTTEERCPACGRLSQLAITEGMSAVYIHEMDGMWIAKACYPAANWRYDGKPI